MKRDKAYLVGVHRYSFKSGVPGEIIGVEIITPDNEKPRLCYHVQWPDMEEDWFAIEDIPNYKIISFNDILKGNIHVVNE
jgi:hypothetical protein